MSMNDGGGSLTHDTIVLCLGDLWTLIGRRIEGVADFERLGICNKCFDELVIDTSLNVDTGPSAATLAMIEARMCVSYG